MFTPPVRGSNINLFTAHFKKKTLTRVRNVKYCDQVIRLSSTVSLRAQLAATQVNTCKFIKRKQIQKSNFTNVQHRCGI